MPQLTHLKIIVFVLVISAILFPSISSSSLTLQDIVLLKDQAADIRRRSEASRPDAGRGLAAQLNSVQRSIARFIQVLRRAGTKVPCKFDESLPITPPRQGKYMFALNLKDNEQDDVFVTVYESGSSDASALWLEILKDLLKAMDVAHRILAGCSRRLVDGEDRISFLADVRNRAAEPLWPNTTRVAEKDDFVVSHVYKLPDEGWPADQLVFINDVWFCAQNLFRLMQHGSDVACGLDFDGGGFDHRDKPQTAEDVQTLLKLWGGNDGSHEPLPTRQLGFYDIWVAHGINGRAFGKSPPYVSDQYSQERLRDGLPIPVQCCWNGMVVLNAAPFRQGLRWRNHVNNECAGSECMLMCDDLWRLGYNKFVVDPGVRLAYTAHESQWLYSEAVQAIKVTSWKDVTDAKPIDWDAVKVPTERMCCEMRPGDRGVDFSKCVMDATWWTQNSTQIAIETDYKTGTKGIYLV